MIDNPGCPVCADRRWKEIGQRTYSRVETDGLSDYVRTRYRVIFEVWRPGSTSLTVTSLLCTNCGIVIYSPRPTAAELGAKYRFLESVSDNSSTVPYDSPRERHRASRLFQIAGSESSVGACILDFGGGDGRLMQGFVEHGAACHLIDYCTTPIPGVTRIGATENDIPEDALYDVIICSHVLEHVADPLQIVERLGGRLKPDGVLYTEVPMEIWKRPPLLPEPVTHINFFTPVSMTCLLSRAGLHVRLCKLTSYPHPNGSTALVIGSIADRSGEVRKPTPGAGFGETQRFLNPSLSLTLRRRALMPSTIFQAAARYLRKAGAARRAPQEIE